MTVFDTPINTNDQSIERVLATGLPVMLVFLDGPASDALEQIMQRLAREYAGQLLLAKVQTRDNPASTAKYQVAEPPTVVTTRGGQTHTRAGSVSAADLESHAAYLLGKGPRPVEQPSQQYGPNGGSEVRSTNSTTGTSAGTETYGTRPVNVTDQDFDRVVLSSTKPVLVDFWAVWCAPCRMTEPVLEKLAHEMPERLLVAKVNVDENPYLAQKYSVQSIPTMMVVKNGQVVDRWMGALPEPALRSKVMAALGR